MGAPKDLLLKNTDLRDQLAAVTHADWFRTALVYVLADWAESPRTSDEFKGARTFQEHLMTFADEPPRRPLMPKPGLHHHLDVDRKTTKKDK